MLAIASMPKPILFVFSEDQRQRARAEAFRRQALNEQQCRKSRNNGGEKAEKGKLALRYHLLGAAGEMAVAALLGLEHELYKDTEARRGSFDLPPNIDVKTRSRCHYDLIVQLDEQPGKAMVLVTIERKQTFVHGWIKSEDAMQGRLKKDPAGGREAFFVPQSKLLPLSTLK